uniref:Lipocalin/cytosolic fatty-acid binding domain-containing protein n=1 Tax=Rhinolophus ferrumequinum TaxID=59479 RepID=A0A671E4D0_RHIFE
MGPLCALGVLLTLLEAGKGQTLKPPPAITPVLQSFQEDQGEWFVVGLAGSTYGRADRSFLNSFIATFEQTGNRRLRVSYAMMRGQRCITWSYVLIPQANPGKFSVNNSRCETVGASLEEVQVHDTNYTTFALMFSRRQSGSQATLCSWAPGRMWAFETQVLGRFVCLVRAHGLSEESVVFPDLTGREQLEGGVGWHYSDGVVGGWGGGLRGSKALWEPGLCGEHGLHLGPTVGSWKPQEVQPEPKLEEKLVAPWSLCPPGCPCPGLPPSLGEAPYPPVSPASGPLHVHTHLHAYVRTCVHKEKCTRVHTYYALCTHRHVHCISPPTPALSRGPWLGAGQRPGGISLCPWPPPTPAPSLQRLQAPFVPPFSPPPLPLLKASVSFSPLLAPACPCVSPPSWRCLSHQIGYPIWVPVEG